jgi:hypothetical protein
MSRKISAAFFVAFASLAAAAAGRAETDPAKDPASLRIRDSFKVDGIALFDAHAQHAPRMGICAQSIFAGLRWCVSGTAEETSGNASYVKTTGYNIGADNRIVYAISSKRSYPLKREEFDGIIQAIGERYGAGATVLAFKKPSEDGTGVDSLIAVWGGIRLVQLTAAEYAQVEIGNSLKRGHLVDHRFNLVTSAKAREPVFKIEGEAGYILHLMSTSPDRADVIARAVYPPVFLPPPAKPGAEPASPLVGETVRKSTASASAERPAAPGNSGAAAEEQAKRIEAERGLAAERLLREEAERKAAEEKAAREAAERKAAAEKKRLEDELKAARERADRAERGERAPTDERRRAEEAERKAAAERREAEERARQLEEQRKALEERRRRDEAEKKAAEERAKRAEAERAEAERKAQEERRRKEEAERKAAAEEKARADAERKATIERMEAEERRRRQEADRAGRDRPPAEERARRAEPEPKVAEERPPADPRAEERRAAERRRAQEESERAAEESRRSSEEQGVVERRAEAERLSRERAQRPDSWRQRAARAAKEAGAIWSFGETQDRVADERTLRSQTIFADGQNGEKGRLAIEVTFECAISGRDRRLSAQARGFDRNSGVRVAFRGDGEGTFGVRTRFMLDDNVPQSGLLFRERQEDTASILEIPMAAGNLSNNAPRGAIWLRHYAVIVEFPLVNGTVTATIAPHADNIRRVLEACAQ